MAKRFTDSLKYKKHFFRNLPGAYKLFYDFLYHDCDHAGIWIVDIETAQIFVGKDMPVEKCKALELFNSDEVRIIPFDGGKKWFIPLFIKFQYGKLSEKNRAHQNVIAILQKFNLLNEDLSPIEEIPKPLWQEPKGDKDMEKEKEMEQETGNGTRGLGGAGEKDERVNPDDRYIGPQMLQVWKQSFPKYTDDKEQDLAALGKILHFMRRQNGEMNLEQTDTQIKVLNTFQLIADQVNREPFWVNKPLKSIANNIQEFYNKIKNPIDATGSKSKLNGKHAATREELNDLANKRFGDGK